VATLAFRAILGHQLPIELSPARFQQSLKRRTHRPLMFDPQLLERRKRFVVLLDDLMARFELQLGHWLKDSRAKGKFLSKSCPSESRFFRSSSCRRYPFAHGVVPIACSLAPP